MNNCTRAFAFGCIIAISSFAIGQESWPQFRGPNASGVVKSIQHPTAWSDTENVAWKVAIDNGWSSPIVVDGKIYITSTAGPMKPVGFAEGVRNMRATKPGEALDFKVTCLNLEDGSEVWSKTLINKMPEFGIHPSNSFATESPISDGKHVFAYFASIGLLAAMDCEGNEVWRKDLGSYPTGNGFGTGSSLAMHDNMIFVQNDNDKESFVAAFDKTTGDEVWRKSRESRTSWATPVIWKNKNRVELVTCGSGFVKSYNPTTGDELWTLNGMGGSFSASPAMDENNLYFGNSGPMSSGPLVAIGSDMAGNHTFKPDTEIAGMSWAQMRSGPGMTSPVSAGGFVYVTGRGTISCFDANSGEQVYKTRMQGAKSAAASFWGDDKQLFFLDETGQTFVIQVGKEYKELGINKIDDLFWSTPSAAGNSLLLRSVDKLYCIRK